QPQGHLMGSKESLLPEPAPQLLHISGCPQGNHKLDARFKAIQLMGKEQIGPLEVVVRSNVAELITQATSDTAGSYSDHRAATGGLANGRQPPGWHTTAAERLDHNACHPILDTMAQQPVVGSLGQTNQIDHLFEPGAGDILAADRSMEQRDP